MCRTLLLALSLVAAASPSLAGPNPYVSLAMHVIPTDEYLYCDAIPYGEFHCESIISSAPPEEIAGLVYGYVYVFFVVYNFSAITAVEFALDPGSWPMSRSSPPLPHVHYCDLPGEEPFVFGDPWDEGAAVTAIAIQGWAPGGVFCFGYMGFDANSVSDSWPITFSYRPSTFSLPEGNKVAGWWPDYPVDLVQNEHGATVGGTHPETPPYSDCNPSSHPTRVWHVPGDAPTIQAGVDSTCPGDTVLVAAGTYYEHDIVMPFGISLLSETGQPDCVTIDAQGQGRVLHCLYGFLPFHIAGITIAGGSSGDGGGVLCDCVSVNFSDCIIRDNTAPGFGGGMRCRTSECTVTDCAFSDNVSAFSGGGVFFQESDMTFSRCTWSGNVADRHGGGLDCRSSSSATLTGCTFYGNSAGWDGGGVGCYLNSSVVLENTIIAHSLTGEALARDETGSPTLTCCDLFGNAGGDWVGLIADQYGINGNICEDPMFCDPDNGDFRLDCASPCVNGYGCGQIGAWGVGCGSTRVEPETWSSLKALFRQD